MYRLNSITLISDDLLFILSCSLTNTQIEHIYQSSYGLGWADKSRPMGCQTSAQPTHGFS